MSVETAPAASLERDWWLRTLLVLQAPRAVFTALHDDSDEAAHARQEPLTAIVLTAGIAGVLGTTIARRLLDDPEFDGLLVAVWAIIGGGIYGIVGYFAVGLLVYLGASFVGGLGSYRRARHVLGYAVVPLALSLVVWPVRLAVFGEDTFRTGGADTGAASTVFEGLEIAFLAWSLALLAIGVRAVHGWTWPRALAAVVLPAALPVLALARAYSVL